MFGRGLFASGPDHKLLVNPPELQVLNIQGLESGHGSRDRWQYLVVSDVPTGESGPIEYRVDIPGYLPKKEVLYAPRLIERLHETVVMLEPNASGWGDVGVRLFGAPQVVDLGLSEDLLIGLVHLVREEDEQIDLAVHPRALGEIEETIGVPTGIFHGYFEAVDSYYQTAETAVQIIRGYNLLTFDLSDAGTLLLDVREGGEAYDMRFVLELTMSDGSQFNSTFDSGPYVVPLLYPGPYRITEVEAPGRTCRFDAESLLEIFPGALPVEALPCWTNAAK